MEHLMGNVWPIKMHHKTSYGYYVNNLKYVMEHLKGTIATLQNTPCIKIKTNKWKESKLKSM